MSSVLSKQQPFSFNFISGKKKTQGTSAIFLHKCCGSRRIVMVEHPMIVVPLAWSLALQLIKHITVVKLGTDCLSWCNKFIVNNLFSVKKSENSFHIASDLVWLSLVVVMIDSSIGTTTAWFQGCTCKPKFCYSYSFLDEARSISDLLLKFCADSNKIFLLVIVQQSWHEFCSSCLMFNSSNKMCCRVTYDSATISQTPCIVHRWLLGRPCVLFWHLQLLYQSIVTQNTRHHQQKLFHF